MKIVRTDAELQVLDLDDRLRADGHEVVLLSDGVSEDELVEALRDADILMMCYTPVTAHVLENAPNLCGILKYGVGIDAIDIPAAKAQGVTVVNIPEYAESTVAEGAFLLALALLKKLPALSKEMNKKGWAWPEKTWLGRDVAGLTFGIVGLGRIGQSFARMAGAGFGADVIAYDPLQLDTTFAKAGVERVASLEVLLDRADVVSLHTILNDETRNMIGGPEMARMKPTALLINVSRGGLVDEEALISALDQGQIAGAGLDVYSREPIDRNHPLHGRPNVILLPHLTFWTEDALKRLEDDCYARLQEMIEGRPVEIRSKDPRLQGQANAIYPE